MARSELWHSTHTSLENRTCINICFFLQARTRRVQSYFTQRTFQCTKNGWTVTTRTLKSCLQFLIRIWMRCSPKNLGWVSIFHMKFPRVIAQLENMFKLRNVTLWNKPKLLVLFMNWNKIDPFLFIEITQLTFMTLTCNQKQLTTWFIKSCLESIFCRQ